MAVATVRGSALARLKVACAAGVSNKHYTGLSSLRLRCWVIHPTSPTFEWSSGVESRHAEASEYSL
jgi:hypothetical protein